MLGFHYILGIVLVRGFAAPCIWQDGDFKPSKYCWVSQWIVLVTVIYLLVKMIHTWFPICTKCSRIALSNRNVMKAK